MLFSGASGFVLARGLMHRGGKAGISAPSAAAAGDDEALISRREFERLFASFVIVDDGANRNLQQNIVALAAGFVGAFAVASALGFMLGIEAEVDEGIVALARFHNDIAALAAVAPRRPAARNKLLAAKGHTAVSTIAGFDFDFCFVNEHGNLSGLGTAVFKSGMVRTGALNKP